MLRPSQLIGLLALVFAVAAGIVWACFATRPVYGTAKPVAEKHAEICAPARYYWDCLEKLGYEITTEPK
jgi:hypothetical protein